MDFGVVLQPDPPVEGVVELAQRAEANGFTHVWVFDSPVLWQEPFVVLSRILAETERVVVGPMVTNPGSRDWTVLASIFASLNDMYGPRTICGIGRGDSALRYIGRKPRSLAEMVDAMRVVKGLVAGESVDYGGKALRFPWLERGFDLPMWGAGYGPRALESIGRHADGFILQLADPRILEWTLAAVREASAAAGRPLDSVATCVTAPAYVGDNIAHQRDQLRWFGGMVGNHVAELVRRYGEGSGSVPAALTAYIRERQGYDYSHHGRAGNPSTDFVPDDIVERFCVLGGVEDHVAKLSRLRDLGADHFAIYLMHDAKAETLDAYGRRVIPSLEREAGRQTGELAGTSPAPRRRREADSVKGAGVPGDGVRAAGEWQSRTGDEYRRKGFSARSGYGESPALLVVDFINGFTDPGTGLGGDYSAEVAVTAKVLEEFRARELPVFFTTVAYEPHLRDGGIFVEKVPALGILVRGSEWVKVDDCIRPRPSERVIEKNYASAFFDTRLDIELRSLGVDTVIMAGCTTSGCIRASAVDSLQYGFRTVVMRDAVGDRAREPHEVNLFDIDAKYGDVVRSGDVLRYLRGLGESAGIGASADEAFRRWWHRSGA